MKSILGKALQNDKDSVNQGEAHEKADEQEHQRSSDSSTGDSNNNNVQKKRASPSLPSIVSIKSFLDRMLDQNKKNIEIELRQATSTHTLT